MVEQNTLIVIGAVLTFLLVIFLLPWGNKCKCGESYQATRNAAFTVNGPKHIIEPTYPVKNSLRRENWIIPTPSKAQTIMSDNLNGSFTTPTSMPYMGGLQNEVSLGVSVPGVNSATTLSGNGQGNQAANMVWKTVI